MRNCYKCCHTNGRKRIKNDGDTTIDGCLPGKEIQPFFYSVLYRMLTELTNTLIFICCFGHFSVPCTPILKNIFLTGE